jgi:DNA helicase II / ATP-dependent DNA helicase PcrA
MLDLSQLNASQREAVTHRGGPLLVLAGAGSGKTRVITFRIAHLIDSGQARPWNILAVTFTNKAAAEMVQRVAKLVPVHDGKPTVGTFHATSLRILRRWADRLGYTKSFNVYDTADQLSVVKRIAREAGYDESSFPPRKLLNAISRAKGALVTPATYADQNRDFYGSRVAEVYHLYQKRLVEFDAMDFDDLIGNHVRLLREHDDVRSQLAERYRFLLIDEYQDTNHSQYALIKELAGSHASIAAVGDEDQSIYRFRGADVNNILNFERDFPGATIVKLEQNYRSTGNILAAASGVVAHNHERIGKTLTTDAGDGEPVRIVSVDTDRDEAQYVLRQLHEMRREVPFHEVAVLFRTNAQSRAFEEELLSSNIPYTVVGGMKFYERAEIKDVLAFMRVAARPQDTPSIERVINVPARGIGAATLRQLQDAVESSGASLWEVIDGDLSFLSERGRRAVGEFRDIARDLQANCSLPVGDFVSYLFERTGYVATYRGSRDPQDETRLQNLDELLNSAREFQEQNPDASVGDYLDTITLISDVDTYDAEKGVTLMTLHAAKGLEFDVVFLTGMEDGILPHSQSQDDVEEERRLCYVGMTRARRRLTATHAMQRRVHGQFREQSPSPFIDEIPESAIERISLVSRTAPTRGAWRDERPAREYGGESTADSVGSFFRSSPVRFDAGALRTRGPAVEKPREMRRGTRVRHAQFGDGVILRTEGSGDNAKLTVYFDRIGTKKFVARFAKLTTL